MIGAILSLIPGEVWAAMGGLVAAILAFLGGRYAGKRQGRSEAKSEALEGDINRAKEVERKADEARRNRDGDPVERLRKSGHIRD